jgi:tetratricopeptide (TPR) repeat protein
VCGASSFSASRFRAVDSDRFTRAVASAERYWRKEFGVMEIRDLLARYEARGDERDFEVARPLFEQAIAEAEEAWLLTGYGYLLESHGRNELRHAAALYERAIELDPDDDKPHLSLIPQALPVASYVEEGTPGTQKHVPFSSSDELSRGRLATHSHT